MIIIGHSDLLINSMLQKVLQSILRKYFGEFITGLEKVELAFWTGKIHIQDASFKHQKINELLRLFNIPLSIKFSFLGSLQIDIPWNKLSSAPVQIKISNVFIVFRLEKIMDDMGKEKDLKQNSKLLLIKNYLSYLIKRSEEHKGEGQQQGGFLKKLMIKVLHNVNLQVDNIHIRIQNHTHQLLETKKEEEEDEFVDCQEEDQTTNIGFSLGFCIESIVAQTIDENSEKKFINVQNDKAKVRKNINLKQITLYWEEENNINLFELLQEKKIEILKKIISREHHRLLTIDGQLLMEKNVNSYDYFFSTSFRLLEIKLNYEQLKQILEVYQQFMNAKTKKKIIKMKQLEYSEQLRLQPEFAKIFQKLHASSFEKVDKDDIRLIQYIDKKLLMKWTRDYAIQIIKENRLKNAFESKNKKSWLNFLSRNAQIDLTEEQIKQIQEEMSKFMKLIDQGDTKKCIGVYVRFELFQMIMEHHKADQNLHFSSKDIEVLFKSNQSGISLELSIMDVSLTYQDLRKKSKINIFRNNSQAGFKFMELQVEDNSKLQKINFKIQPIKIIHEIQFLSFVSKLIQLRKKEKVKAKMILLNQSLSNKKVDSTESTVNQKLYTYRVILKRVEIMVELSSSSQLYAYIDGISVLNIQNQVNSHQACIVDFGIIHINNEYELKRESRILDNLNIKVNLKNGFKVLQSNIPLLKITLNEESLYSIGKCLDDQYKILKIRKMEQKQDEIDEEKFMEGQTEIINVFKTITVYYTILTAQEIYFYEKQHSQINFTKISKKVSIRNAIITRIDEISFKLESVLANEIISCKTKDMADKWIYQIEQRIFENSSKMQMFSMMEESQDENTPNIYYQYDTLIELSVKTISILYQKNAHEKILSLELNKLTVKLQQNNLKFDRMITLDEIKLTNLSFVEEKREQYCLLLSNTYNYFEDPNEDEPSSCNIEVLIQGKKKAHPKYTGQIKITAKFNKLFVNFNTQFVYNILYRLIYRDAKAKSYPEDVKHLKVMQILKDILLQNNGIQQKFASAHNFQFQRSFAQLEKYKQIYNCLVLFHVQLMCDQVEVFLVNGRNNHWTNKAQIEGVNFQIDKSTDFIFLKGLVSNFTLYDITDYPNTIETPFTQGKLYPIIFPKQRRINKHIVEFYVGLFEPLVFANKQRFKNYFVLNLYDSVINYQHQPLMRFIDFLTNQIILFIMQPFSLHKYDTPGRGPFVYGPINFTEKEVKKILFQSIHPLYTHLNISAFNLDINFNSHPNDELILITMKRVNVLSNPFTNPQKIHSKKEDIQIYSNKYQALAQILTLGGLFEQRVSKSQWVTRYIITAEGCKSSLIENQFNYEMYFERSNNGDKDILLPFLRIEKDFLMEGRIKHLNIIAPRDIYNLVNKCFIFNLASDDQCDRLFNANYQFQHLNTPNKLIYQLFLNQLSIVIPEINQTVIVIQNCEYKFVRYEDNKKDMEVNGKSLHILGNQKNNIITPINFEQKKGLEYIITMKPSGEKNMTAFIRHIDFLYDKAIIFPLFKYFILEQSCYPKCEVNPPLPLITCDVYLLNSYIKLVTNEEHVFSLKGDIKVNWTRYMQTHPQTYRKNKSLYPKQQNGSSYDIEFKGVTLRKYQRSSYQLEQFNMYRSLSSSMEFKVNLTNVMKINNDITYTDMIGTYQINALSLKLSYKDLMEIIESFSQTSPQEKENIQIKKLQFSRLSVKSKKSSIIKNQLGYTSHSKHKLSIKQLSLKFGLSQLPVPLIDFSLEKSNMDIQLIGNTKVLTSKTQFVVNYWNMMIGRWQPLIESSQAEITLRVGPFEKYCMAVSNRPVLMNFSIQSLKVLKLIAKDVLDKGNLHVINQQTKAKGIQISPYVITNRTGYNIIIDSEFIMTAKLKNNEKMHLQSKNLELDDKFSTVNYQIQGDAERYGLNLNLNQVNRPVITFNQVDYRLIIWAISSPVVKQIVISSPYVIHNRTIYPLVLFIGQKQFRADADAKVAIPFTEDMHETKTMKLEFPHLTRVTENYCFEFRDIEKGYEHYIIYEDSESFNCLIELEGQNENAINIFPLSTFTNLLPLDIKMELALTKINKQKIVLEEQLQIGKGKIFYQFGSKDQISLRIHLKGFNYSMFNSVNLTNDKEHSEINSNITFIDHRGLETAIKCKIIKKNKRKFVYLYANSIITNETTYKFFIFNQTQLIAGQRIKNIPQSESKYIFINEIKELSIGFVEDDASQAKKFAIQELGEQLLFVNNHDQLHQLVLHNSVVCLQQQAQIFTSILKINPQYLIVNKCLRDLSFQQFNTDQKVYLKVGEIKDWHWYHKDQQRLMTVTLIDNQFELAFGWDTSAPLSLQTLQETILVIRPKDRTGERLLLKIEIFKENQQTHIVFKELRNTQDSLIRIKNDLKLINLEIYQQFLANINQIWIHNKHFSCNSLKQIDFGWDYPGEEHSLVVSFNFIGPYRSKFNNDVVTINLDKMNKPIYVQFKGQNDQLLQVQISVEIVGLRRVLSFINKDESSVSRQNEDDDILMEMSGNNKMGISFKEIGISIIGGKKPRSEIVFISIKKLELIMMEKQLKRNYQLKIKYINIDNNLNHNTIYPVLFTPLKQRKTLEKSRPFIVCLIEQNLKTKQILEINYFRLCVEPISFKVYDEIVTKLYDWQKEFNSIEQVKAMTAAALFRSYEPKFEWETKELIKEGASIFIRQIEIGKIIVQISFSIRPTFSGNIIIYTIFALFKTALSNVSESQMRLSRFICNNLRLGDLANQLSQFYRKEVFKEIYKIAGSINLLGNPYVFVKYLAEGIWEIVNQPSEGFIKGPIEGAIGIGKGGVFFLRNAIAGTFNSIEVITQSCSRGLSYVTFDEKFITRREKIQMQKSRHLGQGTKSAFFALYTGVQVAFTGIYRHPAEEREKSGTSGIFKGLAIGLAGLFTKPMSGLFEAISKFSQGVKQTALFFQDGPNTTRSRPPRIFISSEQYYSDYNLQQSKAINLLQFHSTKHLKKTILLVSVDQHLQDVIYTVLTSDYLVLLSKTNKKILKEIKVVDINEVDIFEDAVRIKYENDEMIINTKKSRQLYECFKDIFTKNEEEEQQDS